MRPMANSFFRDYPEGRRKEEDRPLPDSSSYGALSQKKPAIPSADRWSSRHVSAATEIPSVIGLSYVGFFFINLAGESGLESLV